MSSPSVAQPQEGTFQLEDSLPPLPLPPLEKTLQKYLESTRPFLTADEFENTKQIVAEFGKGVGQELHSRLKEKARNCKNWVEQWWEDLAYMAGRAPLAVQCNINGVPPYHWDIWPPVDGTQCQRAAIVAWYVLEYFQKLRREEIDVEKTRTGKVFSTYQLRGLFCCTRIPGETSDQLVRHFKTEKEGSCPNHIVVFSNGHIFLMRPIDDKGRLMPAEEIYRQLSQIKKMSTSRGQGIGLLTTDDRTSFAKAYKHLRALDPGNQSHLDIIEQCVFTVMLDDAKPKTSTEYMELTFKGDAYSRWADKSYGLVCFSNGIITCTGDHAPYDGMVIEVLLKIIYDKLLQTAGRWPAAELFVGSNYQSPKELVFTVDETIVKAMERAHNTYSVNGSNIVVFISRCGAFGKRLTKSVKIHPDTVFQLALQYAYYSLHHQPVATYETATTRQFYHGRTETVRTCTAESVKWCQSMLDPSKSLTERCTLFLAAVRKHDQNMADATNGQGCDRCLFGLQAMAMELGMAMPALYTDPAFTKSGGGGNFKLSTSCAGYTGSLGAVPPMVEDGYATFYSIADDHYLPCLLAYKSSKETNVEQFFIALNASLADIKNMVTMSNSKM